MTHTPHELAADFPDLADRIPALKASDAHFCKLFDEYHELNRQVHRVETNVEPVEALAETELRKRRAFLKDALYRMLTESGTGG